MIFHLRVTACREHARQSLSRRVISLGSFTVTSLMLYYGQNMHQVVEYHEHSYLVSLVFAAPFLLFIIFSNFISTCIIYISNLPRSKHLLTIYSGHRTLIRPEWIPEGASGKAGNGKMEMEDGNGNGRGKWKRSRN